MHIYTYVHMYAIRTFKTNGIKKGELSTVLQTPANDNNFPQSHCILFFLKAKATPTNAEAVQRAP